MQSRFTRRWVIKTSTGAVATAAGYGDLVSAERQQEQPPVDQPDNVPRYTVEELEDVGFLGTERRVANVTTETPIEDVEFAGFDAISHDIVYDITSDERVNAIAIHFWADGQVIGSESAYAVVDWAPNGSWDEASSVDPGEYDQHEFDYDPEIAIEIEEISGPDTVELGEQIHFGVSLGNHSSTPITYTVQFREWDVTPSPLTEAEIEVPPEDTVTTESDGVVWEDLPDEETVRVTVEEFEVEIEIIPKRLGIGEAYIHGRNDLEIAVAGLELQDVYYTESDAEYSADEGEQFVFVDLEITNVSDEEQEPPSDINFDLLYDDEEYRTTHLIKDEGEYDPGISSKLEPDETESGWLAYEIPSAAGREEVEIRYARPSSDDIDAISWSA